MEVFVGHSKHGSLGEGRPGPLGLKRSISPDEFSTMALRPLPTGGIGGPMIFSGLPFEQNPFPSQPPDSAPGRSHRCPSKVTPEG